jgi:hypothetical protein
MLVMPEARALGRRVPARLRKGRHCPARMGQDRGQGPAEWNGDEPKRATYKAWVTLFMDARVFPSRQAEVSGVRSAPILDFFMERARNARP